MAHFAAATQTGEESLADLVSLVESDTLPVELGWRGPLERFADAADALRGLRVSGKAVLDVVGRSPGRY